MKDLRKTSVLICPRNDEESLMILKIAAALGVAVVESAQPHGAKLGREADLLARIQDAHADAETLVIVELPGEEVEQELESMGYTIVIIDHHAYEGLDRMKPQSSLEQFLAVYEVDDGLLAALGFEVDMVEAVGAIDRGFLWELDALGWNEAKKAKARKFYRSLTMELGGERRLREEEYAREVWQTREERNGFLIIRSPYDDVSVRDAVSFIIAEQIGKPTPLILTQGERRIYVQEVDDTSALYEKFGGFTFGGGRCWGILKEGGGLPSVEEVLEVLGGGK